MLKVVISADEKVEGQPDRPESLQVQVSRLTATNTHTEAPFTLPDLHSLLDDYTHCQLFQGTRFPNDQANRLKAIPSIFYEFSKDRVNPYLCDYAIDLIQGRLPDGFSHIDQMEEAIRLLLRTNTLKRDQRCDMWGVCMDQVWLEFLGVPTSRTRPVPFVESFPLTLWLCQPSLIPDGVVLPKNKWPDTKCKSGDSSNDGQGERDKRQSRQLLKQYYSEDSGEDSSATDSTSEGGLSSSISTSSCDHTDSVQYSSLKVADFNIVARIGGKVRAQLSNPQFLFLMRLIESVTNFQTQLNADIDDSKKQVSNSQEVTLSVPLIIPDLEFAMVCPYIAELLPMSNLGVPGASPDQMNGEQSYLGDVNGSVLGYNESYEAGGYQGGHMLGNGVDEYGTQNTEEVLQVTSYQGPGRTHLYCT